MKHSSIFGHAAELLALAASSRQPADGIARDFFRTRKYLGSKDRKIIAEYFYGVLRHHRYFTHLVLQAGGAPPGGGVVPDFALLMAYAIRVLSVPVEEVAREILPLTQNANGVPELLSFAGSLQRVQIHPDILSDPVASLSVRHSMPEILVKEWLGRFGAAETEALCAALNEPAPTTIRVNTLRCTVDECRKLLEREGIASVPSRLSSAGLTLEKRVNAQGLSPFKEGFFELQDEGSQLIALAVAPRPGEVVIDACAGGGGKTLHLGTLMENNGTLIAVDSEEKRLRTVEERSRRAGTAVAHCYLTGRDDAALREWEGKADAVLIDAPCSAAGAFRRNPWAKIPFGPETVERFARMQKIILDRYASLVKPGGRLVYATCTLTRRENEEQISEFLGRNTAFQVEPVGPRLPFLEPAEGGTLLLLPHRHGTDGFFAASLLRTSGKVR